ncbi:MAG: GTPase [Planctomycetota bacterium]
MSEPASSDALFRRCSDAVQQLLSALPRLEAAAEMLRVPTIAGREWYEVLRQKLAPQLGDEAYLVAAVVGGTNIGQSVIFNHLSGSRASASSPLASGTKHPVCLVPEGFNVTHRLQSVFPDFELHEWSDAGASLEESEDHRLFWRRSPSLPPKLLILDTPDIDSDARVNWVRADAVRRSADVLIAVLTQQKYNDAAVREFFRKAGDEDKAVLIVFNQVLLPEDEPYWPIWLKTFCSETRITPDAVYLAPADRRAAEELRLPFFRRTSSGDSTSTTDRVVSDVDDIAGSLAADLSRFRFQEIRVRTLLGSLREIIHPKRGVPAYLNELRQAGEELSRTVARLSMDSVVQIRDWPMPSNSAIITAVREWWQMRQHGWARKINSAYNLLGDSILWPIRAARKALQGEPIPVMNEYRTREWAAILTVVEQLFEKLRWMASSGNDMIRPHLEPLLQGDAQQRLVDLLREAHECVDFDDELKAVVDHETRRLESDRPQLFRLYSQIHHASAAVRPVTSLVLFSIGFGPAGDLVAPVLGHAAASAVVHVAADVAGGAATAIAGDAAVSSAAVSGAGWLHAWIHSLHAAFTMRRADWLTRLLHDHVLKDLPGQMKRATEVTTHESFRLVQEAVHTLEASLPSTRPSV